MSFVGEFTYDRGALTTGSSAASLQTYAPVYGSSISFTSKNTTWNGGNYNTFIMPQGINNLYAEMDLKFQGGKERIEPLLLRLEELTTGAVIGNEALKEIEYIPGFKGSLNEIRALTGTLSPLQFNEISQLDRSSNGVYIEQNGKIQAYWTPSSNGKIRDIVFPFIINADGKTKYEINFDYTITRNGIDYYKFLVNGYTIQSSSSYDASISYLNPAYGYTGVYNTSSPIKTGYLTLRAYNFVGDDTPNVTAGLVSRITFSNMSMKETYYDTVLNFGNTVNNVTINFDNDYYNNFSGSYIEDYSLNVLAKDVYEVNVKAVNSTNSSLLQNGMAFVNKSNVYDWDDDVREKFDIVSGSANSNVFDNYFYVIDDYDTEQNFLTQVSGLITYTGYHYDVTRTFFWEPDQEVEIQLPHSQRVNSFKNSFSEQLNVGRNQNRIAQLNLTFSNRGQKETYSMLHFFETHLGYKPFVYYFGDGIINQNRVFYCPNWRHTFNYKDSNTITATFVEIPNPTIPEF